MMRSKILAGMTGGPDELNEDLYARADLPPPPLFGRRRVSLSRPEEAAGPALLFFQPLAENGEALREVVAFCHHHHHQERQRRCERYENSQAPQPTHLAVLVAIRFQIPTRCETLLHLEFQAVFACASDVKGSVAGPVCASGASSRRKGRLVSNNAPNAPLAEKGGKGGGRGRW